MTPRLWIPVLVLFAALPAAATEVKIFRADTRDDFLQGTLEGVAVDPLGVLELGAAIERVATLDEPFVFCAAAHPDGWVLGTGNSGKVLKVDPEGAVQVVLSAAEPEVFAVWADPDGTVYAGTSPFGKVYRVPPGGDAEVFFDPEESYIWDLARAADGRLLVATGLRGRLYAVADGGRSELLLDTEDSHLRALEVLRDGSVLVGTAGQGLVMRRGRDGTVRTLYDAVQPEVLDFAPAPDGAVFVALLASEASFVDLSSQSSGTAGGDAEGGGAQQTAVAVVAEGEQTVGSRSSGFTGPRSVVVRLAPNGAAEEVASFQEETVHALLWHDGALWMGTGEEGRVYRHTDAGLVLEKKLPERQVVALVAGHGGPAVVTTNAAALYRLASGREREGSYVSAVLDAGQVAEFGSFLWQGAIPSGTAVELAFRSGMSQHPDATWTAWGEPVEGREVSLRDMPQGRYVQWRARLTAADGATPRLTASELSYRQENMRPHIASLEVLDPGQILVPNNFNPLAQTFEPWSPSREGIFTTLRNAPAGDDGRLKTLWKKGYRTLRWEADDPNEDALRYRLTFRPDGDGEGWLPMVEELDESYYSFDQSALPDGIYRFRLEASDRGAQAVDEAQADERVSEPVVVDNTPPRLEGLERRGGHLTVRLADDLSPLRDAVVSADAGEWRPARALDGLLDGRRESLAIEVPEGARMLLLRVTDAAFNVVTFDLLRPRAE